MSSRHHITVQLPGAILDIDAKGVTEYVGDSIVWSLPLAEAERRLEAALRVVRLRLEVESGGAELLADSAPLIQGSTPPLSLTPYCPFCQAPTCKCWEDHVCR